MSNSSGSDDMAEFSALASKSGPKISKARNEAPEPAMNGKADEEEATPRLVQYARLGAGFAPTTPTVKDLPAGIYKPASTPDGTTFFMPQTVVTDSLLRLPDSKSDEVVTEIERFWTLKDRFTRCGFSHKRGFLLWGPPGSGKTCTVSIVMQKMVEKGGFVVLCDHPGLLATLLGQMREIEKDRPVVVVMEDIDTIIERYGETRVLSLLDGEDAISNVCYLATTNYPENLDGRVINRPSRFDRIVKIGMPNPQARRMYLESRNVDFEEGEVDLWVKETEGFSIAHLKELVVGVKCFGNSAEDEINRLKKMAYTPKSGDAENKKGVGFGR